MRDRLGHVFGQMKEHARRRRRRSIPACPGRYPATGIRRCWTSLQSSRSASSRRSGTTVTAGCGARPIFLRVQVVAPGQHHAVQPIEDRCEIGFLDQRRDEHGQRVRRPAGSRNTRCACSSAACGPWPIARKSVLIPISGRYFMAAIPSLKWTQRIPFVATSAKARSRCKHRSPAMSRASGRIRSSPVEFSYRSVYTGSMHPEYRRLQPTWLDRPRPAKPLAVACLLFFLGCETRRGSNPTDPSIAWPESAKSVKSTE